MNIERPKAQRVHGTRGDDICKRTRAFAVRTIKHCRTIRQDGASAVVYTQLVKAATSIGANVEEAQAAQSVVDFVSKMQIALKEARETRYWFRVAAEAQLLRESDTMGALDEIEQLIRIMFVIVRRTRERQRA